VRYAVLELDLADFARLLQILSRFVFGLLKQNLIE
jgi:hypothetical protein